MRTQIVCWWTVGLMTAMAGLLGTEPSRWFWIGLGICAWAMTLCVVEVRRIGERLRTQPSEFAGVETPVMAHRAAKVRNYCAMVDATGKGVSQRHAA